LGGKCKDKKVKEFLVFVMLTQETSQNYWRDCSCLRRTNFV